jgi:putative FmdB family regulatory protein
VPIYEYACRDCAYTFELKQSIKEEPVAVCARCGKSVTRIISAPAIMFKGSGWYITDYSDKLKPPSGEAAPASNGQKSDSPAAAPAASGATSSSGSGTSASSTPSAAAAPSSGNSSGSTGQSA